MHKKTVNVVSLGFTQLLQDPAKLKLPTGGRIVRARPASYYAPDSEPVRKGRRREINKNDPVLLKCRELHAEQTPLTMIAIRLDLDYTDLTRWNDKGWLNPPTPRKRRAPTGT